jgi:hypothetical protein
MRNGYFHNHRNHNWHVLHIEGEPNNSLIDVITIKYTAVCTKSDCTSHTTGTITISLIEIVTAKIENILNPNKGT